MTILPPSLPPSLPPFLTGDRNDLRLGGHGLRVLPNHGNLSGATGISLGALARHFNLRPGANLHPCHSTVEDCLLLRRASTTGPHCSARGPGSGGRVWQPSHGTGGRTHCRTTLLSVCLQHPDAARQVQFRCNPSRFLYAGLPAELPPGNGRPPGQPSREEATAVCHHGRSRRPCD